MPITNPQEKFIYELCLTYDSEHQFLEALQQMNQQASDGELVVVPAGVAYRFVNIGTGRLRQVDIHASERFVTEWLED